MNQPGLFDKPDPGEVVQAESFNGIENRDGAKWTRYQPRVRVACTECVMSLHEHHGVGPAVRGARWRLTSGNDVLYLCHGHADLRRGTTR